MWAPCSADALNPNPSETHTQSHTHIHTHTHKLVSSAASQRGIVLQPSIRPLLSPVITNTTGTIVLHYTFSFSPCIPLHRLATVTCVCMRVSVCVSFCLFLQSTGIRFDKADKLRTSSVYKQLASSKVRSMAFCVAYISRARLIRVV